MIDSYLAPTDLDEARRRIKSLAALRTRERGLSPNAEDAVLSLKNGSIVDQLNSVTAETVCVVADMMLWRADQRSIDALADALEPDRVLLFLEPTADLGWRRAVHRLGRRFWRIVLRHDFRADVPARLRDSGLVVTTTDRFGVGWRGVRTYVWGEAQHFPDK